MTLKNRIQKERMPAQGQYTPLSQMGYRDKDGPFLSEAVGTLSYSYKTPLQAKLQLKDK